MARKVAVGCFLVAVFALCEQVYSSDNPVVQDRTNTLTGDDLDGNGVRDDIDEYISLSYPTEFHKPIEKYAKALQATLLVDVNDRLALNTAHNQLTDSIVCIIEKKPTPKNKGFDLMNPVSEIKVLTTNTKKRLLAYSNFDHALDGKMFSIPKKKVCLG